MVIIRDVSVQRGDIQTRKAVVPNFALPCSIMSGFIAPSVCLLEQATCIALNNIHHLQLLVAGHRAWAVITGKKKCDNTSCLICVIKPQPLHIGGLWCSPIRKKCILCIQTHPPNIHAFTINMNWWVLNCKACKQRQNSISNNYLMLPFIRKSSKLLDGGK